MSGTSKTCREAMHRRTKRPNRRGTVLVMAAFMMIVMMALLAMSVDLGYVTTVNSELKRATDAAALAGAGALVEGVELAHLEALKYHARNPVAGNQVAEQEDWEAWAQLWLSQHPDEFVLQAGHWYPDNPKPEPGEEDPRFVADDQLPSAVRVQTVKPNTPLFFARLLGKDSFSVAAESIARYQPRDIVVVLDFSGSMNDDSELKRIKDYGESVRATVEANLLEIYEDLGSPVYGNMVFEPQYISSYKSKYEIKEILGLLTVPYPYPSGSWDNYIDYVQDNSNVNGAGYRNKYGYMTLINYWLEKKCEYDQTPDLWKVRAEPVATVKDATGVFLDYLRQVDIDDRVGLVVYNSPSQDALLEETLTENFDDVESAAQHRQAGHYDIYTNIGAGIRVAKEELQTHARTGAFKMIVLMTDGQANKPDGNGNGYALEQAQAVAAEGWPILTISLGNGADTNLMQQIADITDGIHFNVPGGSGVTDYREDLLQVLKDVADHRPLVLVK